MTKYGTATTTDLRPGMHVRRKSGPFLTVKAVRIHDDGTATVAMTGKATFTVFADAEWDTASERPSGFVQGPNPRVR